MTREQIEKAGRDYALDQLGIVGLPGRAEAMKAFVAGADWRIKSVWHDAREMPKPFPITPRWLWNAAMGARHRSHIGRVISDFNIKCLCDLYFRFECIDEQGREYQQPYFANGHQDEAIREVVL